MEHRQQRDDDVEIRGWTLAITPEPTKGPWEAKNNAAESVEGNQPGQLERQWQGRGHW